VVFSSPIFLFLFLPVVLVLHAVAPSAARNPLLLLASLVFYAWGEPGFVPVLLGALALNWALGWGVGVASPRLRPVLVAAAVLLNLGLLVAYKYGEWLVASFNSILVALGGVALPVPRGAVIIGLSFITFQALSYVIDVARREVPPQRNPFTLALYVMLFPQLVAGPIVRYRTIADQLVERRLTRAQFADGVHRFILGLGKKVLIANPLAVPVDAIFALPPDQVTTGLAWLAALCYTLQIYFDFSGYSDMAVGLGHLFGFRLPENFRYPYVARGLTDFWRRWHISLSTWFRDYLYIPLGGNRVAPGRVYANLLVVFLLCGLWHGASWTFVAWGLYHGAFLVLERLRLGPLLDRLPSALAHGYTLAVVVVGWVLFRAPTFEAAWAMLRAMVGLGGGPGIEHDVRLYWDTGVAVSFGAGVLGALPLGPTLAEWRGRLPVSWRDDAAAAGRIVALGLVFLGCAMMLAAGTHNPFIYFRF
jgi:alginate O-acetyltransferase complex protein AlgI